MCVFSVSMYSATFELYIVTSSPSSAVMVLLHALYDESFHEIWWQCEDELYWLRQTEGALPLYYASILCTVCQACIGAESWSKEVRSSGRVSSGYPSTGPDLWMRICHWHIQYSDPKLKELRSTDIQMNQPTRCSNFTGLLSLKTLN